MKKLHLLALLLPFFFFSCQDKTDYQAQIQGAWLCTEMNSYTQPTNAALLFSFTADNGGTFSYGSTNAENTSTQWITTEISYHINENQLHFSFYDAENKPVTKEYTIVVATDKRFVLDDNGTRLTLNKIEDDFTTALPGMWQDDEKTKFTFTNDNRLLIINDENAQTADYQLHGELLSIQFPQHYDNFLITFQDSVLFLTQYQKLGAHDLSVKSYRLHKIL